MGYIELPLSRAMAAPGLDEFAIFCQLHDPRIRITAMSIGNEDFAIRRHQNIRGSVEQVWTISRDTGLA